MHFTVSLLGNRGLRYRGSFNLLVGPSLRCGSAREVRLRSVSRCNFTPQWTTAAAAAAVSTAQPWISPYRLLSPCAKAPFTLQTHYARRPTYT